MIVRQRSSSIFYIFCFYFSSFCYRRDLHSFPTRRSSDLVASVTTKGCSLPSVMIRPLRMPTTAPSTSTRSEEHTSELQSRRDLVCRLLLEKKNKKCYAPVLHVEVAHGGGPTVNPAIFPC